MAISKAFFLNLVQFYTKEEDIAEEKIKPFEIAPGSYDPYLYVYIFFQDKNRVKSRQEGDVREEYRDNEAFLNWLLAKSEKLNEQARRGDNIQSFETTPGWS